MSCKARRPNSLCHNRNRHIEGTGSVCTFDTDSPGPRDSPYNTGWFEMAARHTQLAHQDVELRIPTDP